MGQAQLLPWTHEGLDESLRKGQYEDVPTDDDETEGLEDDSSAALEHETRQVNRKSVMQASSSRSLAGLGGEAVLLQTTVRCKTNNQREQCPRTQPKSQKQEARAVFLSLDVTSSASQQKAFCESTGTVRGKTTEEKDSRGEREEPFPR